MYHPSSSVLMNNMTPIAARNHRKGSKPETCKKGQMLFSLLSSYGLAQCRPNLWRCFFAWDGSILHWVVHIPSLFDNSKHSNKKCSKDALELALFGWPFHHCVYAHTRNCHVALLCSCRTCKPLNFCGLICANGLLLCFPATCAV